MRAMLIFWKIIFLLMYNFVGKWHCWKRLFRPAPILWLKYTTCLSLEMSIVMLITVNLSKAEKFQKRLLLKEYFEQLKKWTSFPGINLRFNFYGSESGASFTMLRGKFLIFLKNYGLQNNALKSYFLLSNSFNVSNSY